MNRRAFLTYSLASASLTASGGVLATTNPSLSAQRVFGLVGAQRFDNFIVGASNRTAVVAANSCVAEPGIRFNSFLIHGDTGTGKAHLLRAMATEMVDSNPMLKARCMYAEQFVTEMTCACQPGPSGRPMCCPRSLALLLIGALQFLATRWQEQAALQSIFDALHSRHRQMLFTTDVHPWEMRGFGDSLKSRLGSGLTCTIDLPDIEMRSGLVDQEARERGLEIHPQAAARSPDLSAQTHEL